MSKLWICLSLGRSGQLCQISEFELKKEPFFNTSWNDLLILLQIPAYFFDYIYNAALGMVGLH